MGLLIEPGLFSGSYSSFDKFRQAVAELYEHISETMHDEKVQEVEMKWEHSLLDKVDCNLLPFFNHSDCDGFWTPEECGGIARGLQRITKRLEDNIPSDLKNSWKVFQSYAKTMIEGCLFCEKNGVTASFG